MRIVLWRSASSTRPKFGYDTAWSSSQAHARWYMDPVIDPRTGGRAWGGDGLFRAEVDIDPTTLLDLRADPWGKMRALGVERNDYATNEDYEVIGRRVPEFARRGYRWVAFMHGPEQDEWIYLTDVPIHATLVDTHAAATDLRQ